jgi:glycosyltransferase involved in cell wall biosynthesis
MLTDREKLLHARAHSLEIAQRFNIVSIADLYEKIYHEITIVSDGIIQRTLILNSEYPPVGGGAANASANLARCLTALGHEVTVVTSRYNDLPHCERSDRLLILRIPALRRKQNRTSAFELIVFMLSASLWILRFFFPRTRNSIPPYKPDTTLAFFGLPSGGVALLLKVFHKIPYIISLRGGDVPGFRPYDFSIYHKLTAPLLRKIWENASAIVANSAGLRHLALQFDSRFEIPVIPNGVDLEFFKEGIRENQSSHIFSVGRIVHQKGLDLALHALSGLIDLEWDWQIAGDGPQMAAFKSLAQKLGLQDRVRFLGWQSQKSLVEQYNRSNLFLFPSRHEGMPNAVLEAMASGLPVIASRISGNEELVVDGQTGLLFPSEDVDSLRDALRKLIMDASLRRKMGAASRRRVQDRFKWESVGKQYARLLEQVE